MAEETLYTIGRLAELAGVTPRTIRYYTAEGLLPRPDARGQYALYGEQHRLRLQLIAQLKETYLPLSEIKARIDGLDDAQMRALLDEHTELPATSAADYLAQVQLRQQVSQPARQLAERAESYAAAEMPTMSLRPPAAPTSPAPAAPAYGFAVPISAPTAAPAAAPEQPEEAAATPQQAGLLRRLMPQRRAHVDVDAAKPEAAQAEQHWRRVELVPGVELHIREPTSSALHERIERLLALAHSLFKAND